MGKVTKNLPGGRWRLPSRCFGQRLGQLHGGHHQQQFVHSKIDDLRQLEPTPRDAERGIHQNNAVFRGSLWRIG